MDHSKGHGAFTFAKQLPYKKWWFWLILALLMRVGFMSYENSRSIVYDAQALGFSSEAEMNAAFVKGYHSRQKMEEMARFYAEQPPIPPAPQRIAEKD